MMRNFWSHEHCSKADSTFHYSIRITCDRRRHFTTGTNWWKNTNRPTPAQTRGVLFDRHTDRRVCDVHLCLWFISSSGRWRERTPLLSPDRSSSGMCRKWSIGWATCRWCQRLASWCSSQWARDRSRGSSRPSYSRKARVQAPWPSLCLSIGWPTSSLGSAFPVWRYVSFINLNFYFFQIICFYFIMFLFFFRHYWKIIHSCLLVYSLQFFGFLHIKKFLRRKIRPSKRSWHCSGILTAGKYLTV